MGYADLERNGFWVCHEHFTKSFAPQMGLFCAFRNRRSNATAKPDMWDAELRARCPHIPVALRTGRDWRAARREIWSEMT